MEIDDDQRRIEEDLRDPMQSSPVNEEELEVSRLINIIQQENQNHQSVTARDTAQHDHQQQSKTSDNNHHNDDHMDLNSQKQASDNHGVNNSLHNDELFSEALSRELMEHGFGVSSPTNELSTTTTTTATMSSSSRGDVLTSTEEVRNDSNITGHAGTDQYLGAGVGTISPASHSLRLNSLPALNNLACQLLEILGRQNYQTTLNMITQPDSDQGKAYVDLLNVFGHVKSLYTSESFISPKSLAESGQEQGTKSDRNIDAVIQRANMATFVAAVFGSLQIGFYDLNEWFITVFAGRHGKLLKSQAILYLDLKTQAFISAMGQLEKSREEILEVLFPDNLAEVLLSGANSKPNLTPGEHDFITRCSRRRKSLESAESLDELASKYQWLSFMSELHDYLYKNINSILTGQHSSSHHNHNHHQNATGMSASSKQGSNSLNLNSATKSGPGSANAIEGALGTGVSGVTALSGGLLSTGENESSDTSEEKSQRKRMRSKPKPILTDEKASVAYLEAMQGFSSGKTRTPGQSTPLNRKPWTKEEEEALLQGLDKVKGPFWSQILDIHGPGGSESEILKDRTQVQLKDKARNLKLFFIKCGLPLPAVFKYVTGDIKSRQITAEKLKQRKRDRAAAAAAASGVVASGDQSQNANTTGLPSSSSSSSSGVHAQVQIQGDQQPISEASNISNHNRQQHQPLLTMESGNNDGYSSETTTGTSQRARMTVSDYEDSGSAAGDHGHEHLVPSSEKTARSDEANLFEQPALSSFIQRVGEYIGGGPEQEYQT